MDPKAVYDSARVNNPPPPDPAPLPRPVPGPDPVPPQLPPGEIPEVEPGAALGLRVKIAILNIVSGFGQNVSDFIVCATCNTLQGPQEKAIFGNQPDD